MDWSQIKPIDEIVKDAFETLAWIAAGGFFVYKVATGFFNTNMSIKVCGTERTV